jgi:Ycf66 protein N-terminus
MLAYILALTVGLGSLAIYMAAFFFPEIHRKNDFIWSGVGLFYALVLWVCAGRITGGLLLGQVASVALLGWSVTQTLQLRRQLIPKAQQTELPSSDVLKSTIKGQVSKLSLPGLSGLQQRFSRTKDQTPTVSKVPKDTVKAPVEVIDRRNTPPQPTVPPVVSEAIPPQPAVTPVVLEAIPPQPAVPPVVPEAIPPQPAVPPVVSEAISPAVPEAIPSETVPEAIPPHPPSPELVAAAQEHQEHTDVVFVETPPEAELAPPAEEPPEEIPPTTV